MKRIAAAFAALITTIALTISASATQGATYPTNISGTQLSASNWTSTADEQYVIPQFGEVTFNDGQKLVTVQPRTYYTNVFSDGTETINAIYKAQTDFNYTLDYLNGKTLISGGNTLSFVLDSEPLSDGCCYFTVKYNGNAVLYFPNTTKAVNKLVFTYVEASGGNYLTLMSRYSSNGNSDEFFAAISGANAYRALELGKESVYVFGGGVAYRFPISSDVTYIDGIAPQEELTEGQILAKSALTCPLCKSKNVTLTRSGYDIRNSGWWYKIKCNDCLHEWDAILTDTDLELIEELKSDTESGYTITENSVIEDGIGASLGLSGITGTGTSDSATVLNSAANFLQGAVSSFGSIIEGLGNIFQALYAVLPSGISALITVALVILVVVAIVKIIT